MALNVARGFLNTTTNAAGNTVVVNTLGFTPKVVFFWWNGRVDTTDAVGRRTHQTGFGYAVSTTDRRYATCLAQDTPTTMVTNRMQGNAACIGITTTADAIDGLMDLQSFDTDTGFTLVIDDAFTASYTIHYMALGGSDVVNVGGNNFTMATVTGNQDVEQVSFLPNFVLFFTNGQQSINNSVSADSGLTIGAAKSSSNRYTLTGGSNDGAGNAQAISYSYDGECIALLDSALTVTESRADFVNFHSSPANGFRINWLENAASTKIISYVAIEFTNANYVALGDLLTRTDANDIVESGLPFKPLGAMFLSHCKAKSTQDTVQDDHELSIGAFTSTSSRSATGMMDDDAAATAVVGTAVEFDEIYVNMPNTAATVEGLMDIKSIENDGFTTVMDDTDPAQAFVWYMAFGAEHITINCSAATIASAGQTATITPGAVTIQASAGVIASAGRTATISTGGGGQTVQASAATIASAGQTATVVAGAVSIQTVTGTLTIAGRTASVIAGAVTVQTAVATVDTNGISATINNIVTVQTSTGALTSSGQHATLLAGAVTIQASTGAIIGTGQIADVQPGAVTITANSAIIASSGLTASVSSSSGGATILVGIATIASAGQTATIIKGAVAVATNIAILDNNGITASIVAGTVTVPTSIAAIAIIEYNALIQYPITIQTIIATIDSNGLSAGIGVSATDLIVDSDDIYVTGVTEWVYVASAIEWVYIATKRNRVYDGKD